MIRSISDERIAFHTRRLGQALRATDDVTAFTKNKDGQHLILVTAYGLNSEIQVSEGNTLGSGHVEFVGDGVLYARVRCRGCKTFALASTGDFDLEAILAHLRGK